VIQLRKRRGKNREEAEGEELKRKDERGWKVIRLPTRGFAIPQETSLRDARKEGLMRILRQENHLYKERKAKRERRRR